MDQKPVAGCVVAVEVSCCLKERKRERNPDRPSVLMTEAACDAAAGPDDGYKWMQVIAPD